MDADLTSYRFTALVKRAGKPPYAIFLIPRECFCSSRGNCPRPNKYTYFLFLFLFFFAEDPPFFPRHDPALRSLSLFFFLHVASSFRFDIFFIHQKVLRAMRKETRLNYNVIGKRMRSRPIKILATIESMDVIIKYQSVNTLFGEGRVFFLSCIKQIR